jgi:hypothetical protein
MNLDNICLECLEDTDEEILYEYGYLCTSCFNLFIGKSESINDPDILKDENNNNNESKLYNREVADLTTTIIQCQ